MIHEFIISFTVTGGLPSLDGFGGPRLGPRGFMFVSDSNIRAWLRRYWEMLELPLMRSWRDIEDLSVRKTSDKRLGNTVMRYTGNNLDSGFRFVDSLLGFPFKDKRYKDTSWVFGPLQISFAVSEKPVDVSHVKVTSAFADEGASQRRFGLRYAVWDIKFVAYATFTPEVWSNDIWKKFFDGTGKILVERGLMRSLNEDSVSEFIRESLQGSLSTRFSGVVKVFSPKVEEREHYMGPVEMWEILMGGVESGKDN